jgi:hypothetical protein
VSSVHLGPGKAIMPDLFVALSPAARQEHRASYYEFLLARDGALDIEKRTLSRREEGMVRYSKPLPTIRQLDHNLFKEQYAAFDAAISTPPEVLLLLALVKVNAAEAYGVNTNFDKVIRKLAVQGDALELTLLVEELYHTRILLSSAVLYGMEINAPYKPSTGLRALIHGIGHGPEFLARPLTLAGEIMGTLFFLNLLGKAGEILRHDAELRDAIEERLCEIARSCPWLRTRSPGRSPRLRCWAPCRRLRKATSPRSRQAEVFPSTCDDWRFSRRRRGACEQARWANLLASC